ncbi:OmpH family outer membrane protein [Thermodesulfobacteriota bacterium]
MNCRGLCKSVNLYPAVVFCLGVLVWSVLMPLPTGSAENRIGIVDMKRFVEKTAAGRDAKERLNAAKERFLEELKQLKRAYEDLKAELDDKQNEVSTMRRLQINRDLKQKANAFEKKRTELQNELSRLTQKLNREIKAKAFADAQELGRNSGFPLIIEKRDVIYLQRSDFLTDITEELIRLSDRKYESEKIERKAWSEAKTKDSVAAYRAFNEQYPESNFIKNSHKRIGEIYIEEKEWYQTLSTNTEKAYLSYVSQFPRSKYYTHALKKLPENSPAKRKHREQVEVEKIMKSGVGKRTVISDLLPGECSTGTDCAGRATLVDTGREHISFQMEYPGDSIPSKGSAIAPIETWGSGSILRFKGTHKIKKYLFVGNKKDPLAFLLLKDKGLVYINGKGTVRLSDGSLVNLPFNK